MKAQKYKTSTGKTVKLQPVSYYKVQGIIQGIEKEMRDAGEPIDPPTYEVKIDGDSTQVHEHYHIVDPETGEVNTSIETEEEQAAWDAYVAANQKLQAAAVFPTLRFCLRHGVVVDMDADKDWEADQKFDGIPIPEDSREKYFHYILTEVIPTPAEQKEVSEIIMIASMSGDAETEEAVKALFRG